MLSPSDQAMLDGDHGGAVQLAMRLIVQLAAIVDAPRLIDVTCAHIDSCLYHGPVGVDFAERLVQLGGQVKIPTTLNVSSLDLLHPDHYIGAVATATQARRLMDAYVALGCAPTWTCAPYQLPQRPTFGEQIAWAESNAIVFANSVLGARTNRYGDFIDICAALTGRVPDAGLHQSAARRGELVFQPVDIPERLLHEDIFYAILGHIVGAQTGNSIPVIDGLPATVTEDQLKALGAGAASSGAVALFHAVGITPEAPTLDAALQGQAPLRVVKISPEMVLSTRDELCTSDERKVAGISLGTPHFSVAEFAQLLAVLAEVKIHPKVDFWISTGRDVLAEVKARGWDEGLRAAGVKVVVDTCTYITAILRDKPGVMMTNSAKWAHYAPGNVGAKVVFGSLYECVRSAERGEVWRDESLWQTL
jgi:predicted aconitase